MIRLKLYMPSTTFRLVALIWAAALCTSWAVSDEELLARADNAFAERKRLREDRDPRFKTAVWDSLSELSADERTRAVLLWMLSLDEFKPDSPRTTQPLSYAIFDDPRLVENEDGFRRMLQHEDDPRRFYLISSIANMAVQRFGYDFVSCRARMLLRDGAVAKPEGELNPDHIHDVSISTYGSIVYNLEQLGADYEAPEEDLSHEAKIDHLVGWLRESWPGCEKIGLEAASSSRHQDRQQLRNESHSGRPTVPDAETSENAGEMQFPKWVLWISGGILAAALIAYFANLWPRGR